MIEQVLHFTLPATRALLPAIMFDSPRAWAMLLAIGLQESKFLARRQDDAGPARGFWQFERGGGCRGVMSHPHTRELASDVLRDLRYGHLVGKVREVHYTLHDNDVLACAFARLLLWTVPGPLPTRTSAAAGWSQYLEGWRPGAPHAATWNANYAEAWDRLEHSWPLVSPGKPEWSD